MTKERSMAGRKKNVEAVVDKHVVGTLVDVVAFCGRCDRISAPKKVSTTAINGERFVPDHHIGYCECGAAWQDGTSVQNPTSLESRLAIAERTAHLLRSRIKEQAVKIEAYEKAMTLMGGRPTGRSFFGMPY